MNTMEITEDFPVELTEKAIIAVQECIAAEEIEEEYLRIFINGGGCAGYQYGLDFTGVRDFDLILKFDGLDVLMDPFTASLLEGTSIDYVIGLAGTGFKFNNPYAKSTCGCGSSFSM